MPVGAGQGSGLTNRALAAAGGAETHTLSINELPAHTHEIGSSPSNTPTTGGQTRLNPNGTGTSSARSACGSDR